VVFVNALLQNAVAVLLVLACAAYVAWQLTKTIRAGNGKAGSCCSKGCTPDATPRATAGTREQFISSDSLRRRK
jgi:hypothetical protein